MIEKQIVKTDKAPKALGPYSVGVLVGSFIFASGQLGLDPQTGEIVQGGVEAETIQALSNIRSVLEAADSGLDRVIKTTVFLRDMADFAKMNAVYGSFFKDNFPARSTVQVAALPKAGAVEIEVIALA